MLFCFSTKLYSFTPMYPDEDKTFEVLSYKFGYEVWSVHSFSTEKNTYLLLGPLGSYNISKTSTKIVFSLIGLSLTILTILWLKKRKNREVEPGNQANSETHFGRSE